MNHGNCLSSLNIFVITLLIFLITVPKIVIAQSECSGRQSTKVDPYCDLQWHLTGKLRDGKDTEVHINVQNVWNSYKGEGMFIGVVDTGILKSHPDLYSNIDDVRKRPSHPHGTMVAGVIAAVENNSIGGRGVAPKANIFGGPAVRESTNVLNAALVNRHKKVAVYNNSWGHEYAFSGGDSDSMFRKSIGDGLNDGFAGKGSVYVFSAGNSHCIDRFLYRDLCGYRNSNYDSYTNHHGLVTVGAVGHDGKRAHYSEMGANLWTAAPSRTKDKDGIYTTSYNTLIYKSKYTDNFGGTSAAAPQVSGVVALMRQAKGSLTWRDVKLILAASAKKIDPNGEGCIEPDCLGNGTWMEGGSKYGSPSEKYDFNHQYGFGLVDASAAVELAQNWTMSVPEMDTTSKSTTFDTKNLGSTKKISSEIKISTDDIDFIEFIDITLTGWHLSFSDLAVNLISESGSISELAVPVSEAIGKSKYSQSIDTNWDNKKIKRVCSLGLCRYDEEEIIPYTWRFGSARHLGEKPNGTWKLEITDRQTGRLSNMQSWGIKFYGHISPEFSDNANLANLSLQSDYSGKIDLDILSNKTDYVVNVDSNMARVKAIPDLKDDKARITKNTANSFINLKPGQSQNIEIEVTAQNGSKKTYTIAVTRATSQQSNDLIGLSLSDGVSLNFSREKRSYTVNVANSVRSISVTPTASNSATKIEVNGQVVMSGRASNAISIGEGSRTIQVILTTGNDRETYFIVLTRTTASVDLSDDATLKDLRLSGVDLNESFSSGKVSYTVDVGSNTNSITVTPTANHQGATIKIDGSTVASGRSKSINLSANQQTIRIVVTSEDSSSIRTYKIAVTRAQSSNADLIGLSLGNAFLGYNLSSIGLAPAPATFSPSKTAYWVSIYEGYSVLEMHVIAKDPTATITVNGELAKSNVKHDVNIKDTNTVIVKVTSGDKSVSKEYILAVLKLDFFTTAHSAPGLSDLIFVQPSGNNVRLEGSRRRVGFDPLTSDYYAEVDTDVEYVAITPVVGRSDGVQITVNGQTVASGNSINVALEPGDNDITVVVTLLQGGNSNTYTVEVERAYSDDNTLRSLRLVHIIDRELSEEINLDPPFYSRKRKYEVRVGSDIDGVDVFPIANDSEARIRVNNSRLRRDSDYVALSEGENEIEVSVEAENGDRREYVIEIWRGSADDATLYSLKLSGGVSFERVKSRRTSIRTSYRVDVGSNVGSVIATPIANDPDASVTIVANGETVGSGQVGRTINLNEGENTITINVVSKDGNNAESYTIGVTRATAGDVSLRRTPYLSGRIDLSRSLSNEAIYTGEADYDKDRTKVEINTNDGNAGITINGESVDSGEQSSDIELDVGVNIITVHVQSSNRSAEQIYTIIVTRSGPPVDYDSDNDNLIEVRNLEQLDAMRYGINGGDIHALAFPDYDINNSCAATCIGYELMMDLDFEDDASYQKPENRFIWTDGEGWQPIGIISGRDCGNQDSQCFASIFDGNGYSIANLFINRADEDYIGLFSGIASGAHIRNLGIVDAQIVGDNYVGTLAGVSEGGNITNSYAIGNIVGDYVVGGLVGHNYNGGTLAASYATVDILGDYATGGLVGRNSGFYREDSGGTITDSYASGNVSGRSTIGGLVGHDSTGYAAGIGSISNSYATGFISGTLNIGGLRGSRNYDNDYSGSVNNSYWNTDTTGQTQSSGGVGLSTMQMISPTAPNVWNHPARYTNWNSNKWHFGNNQQYPAVRYFGNCENVSSNNPNLSEGNEHQPDCGDLLPGQRAYLAALSLSNGATLLHSFNRLSTHHVAMVGLSILSIDIAPTASDSMDTITVKENTTTTTIVNGGTYTISLKAGKNLINIIVTSQDGSVKTYTLELWQVAMNVDYDTDDDNLIEISNLEQLDAMRYDLDGNGVSDKAKNYGLYQQAYPGFSGCAGTCIGYELTTDLDFDNDNSYNEAVANKDIWTDGEGWQPISGGYGKAFNAVLEGNDYTISNLFIDRGDSNAVALFGIVANNAQVRNTGLVNIQVTGNHYVGGLIGRNYGGTITNSYASGSVVGSGDYVSDVGGLVGANRGTITNSYASGSVVGNGERDNYSVGGLVGNNHSGTITNSYASGSVVGNGERVGTIGGLVGSNGSGTITNSYALGSVVGNGERVDRVGGLAGYNHSGTITNSYASGGVVGNGERYNIYDIGGLVGYNGGTITSSYASGSVVGNSDSVGGLVGQNGNGTITSSYAIGNVSGDDVVGGLIGQNSGTVTSSYWDTETTRQLTSNGGIALTTTQMITPTAPDANNPDRYSGWTSTNWNFGDAQQYPAVRYAEHCENITENNISFNEGDLKQPDCGDLLPGQRSHLMNLVLSDNAELSPSFSSVMRYYAVNVDVNVTALQITPTVEAGNTISIDGREIESGSPYTVSLQSGSNMMYISVTGADGFSKTYHIIISRGASVNYDEDDDTLIEIHTLEQLDAIRYDKNGDGISDRVSNYGNYLRIYPGFSGCSSTCTGYELAGNLDFQNNASYQDTINQSSWTSGEGWQPIASFDAIFEGNSYTINNLFIDQKDARDIGLFGSVTKNAKIRNVGLINVQIIGGLEVGGLIGNNSGTVSDSYVSGTVSGEFNVGGLVGQSDGTISSSYAAGNVKGSILIGGLIGRGYGDTNAVSNSYATSKVSGKSDVGGLVGLSSGTVSNSYATGDVSGKREVGGLIGSNRSVVSDSYATGDVSGEWEVGGLIGSNRSVVSSSYAMGDVSGGGNVGGLIGENWSAISSSYATGNVSGNNGVGGLIGVTAGAVSNSYATGNVSGDDKVGGLIGDNYSAVSNSHASGNVRGINYVGGLIGENNYTISNSYASASVSGAEIVGGLVGSNSDTVSNSYASGIVTGLSFVGGLIGDNANSGRSNDNSIGEVINSYAIGHTEGTEFTNGLVGNNTCIDIFDDDRDMDYRERCPGRRVSIFEGTISASYWDTNTTGQPADSSNAGFSTTLLLAPTAPNAVNPSRYSGWDTTNWHFGSNTQYPAVRYVNNCEGISSNNPNRNEGDVNQPDCGDLLPGQRHAHLLQRHAHLLSVSLSDNATLVPPFNKTILSYRTRVAPDVSSIGIVVTAEADVQKITISGTTVLSGDAYTIDLPQAQNTIDIAVTALAGTTKTYSITVWKAAAVNYDKDDDGLIEVNTLEQLDAMRYDLDGDGISDNEGKRDTYLKAYLGFTGCLSSCEGYELAANLDFQDDDSYQNIANKSQWTSEEGWLPIPRFDAVFEGNGYRVRNLFIDRKYDSVGLFGSTGRNAHIRNIGLIDVVVKGSTVGALVGANYGTVSNSYVEGGSVHGEEIDNGEVGGLIGSNGSRSSGGNRNAFISTVYNSYAKVRVSGHESIGGLVGYNNIYGAVSGSYATGSVSGDEQIGGLVGVNGGTVVDSYATGDVTGRSEVGGLVGRNFIDSTNRTYLGAVTNSYAIGLVQGEEYIGGLVGKNIHYEYGANRFSIGRIYHSHWNIETSKQLSGGGDASLDGGSGLSELDMTLPTEPNQNNPNRYVGWDEAHWDFGNTQQYPALRYVKNCEDIDGNSNINLNEDTPVPDCGDLLPGQRDVSLTRLSLSNNVRINPAFDKDITDYRAYVLTELKHLAVRVVASADVEAVTVNGKYAANESVNVVSLETGDNIITIVVTGGNGTIAKSYVITVVRRDNNAPRVQQELTDQVAEVGKPFSYAIPQNAFLDADNDGLIYYIRGLPQRIDWFSDDGITFDPTDNTFSGTPGYRDASQDSNQHIITVGVNDRYGGTTESSFMLLVNSEPTGTMNIEADVTTMQLLGRSTLDDANGGIVDMDYQWQKEGEDGFTDIPQAESSSYVLPNNKKSRAIGTTYRLNTVMTDGIGEVSGSSADYTLPNWPPSVAITRSTPTIVEGDVLLLEAQGSDPNLEKITYRWRQLSGPDLLKGVAKGKHILEVPIPESTIARRYISEELVFAVTVQDKSDNRNSTQVTVLAQKIDNGQVIELGSPVQNGSVLTAPPIDLSSDIDGVGRVTGYQWQISTDNRVSWVNIPQAGASMSYTVPDSTTDGTHFRVSISYEDKQGHSISLFSRVATYAAGNNQPIIDLPVHDSIISIMSNASTDVRVVISDTDTTNVLTVTLEIIEGDSIIESTPTSLTVMPNSQFTRDEQLFTIVAKQSGIARIRIGLRDDSGVAGNANAEPVILNVNVPTSAIRVRVKVFLESSFKQGK